MAEKTTTKKAATKKPEEKKLISFVEVDEKKEEIKNPIIESAQKLASANADMDDSGDEMGDFDISEEIAKSIKDSAGKPDRYYEAIGRRKTAVARIRLYTKGDKEFIVNDQDYTKYFQTVEDRESAVASMKKMKCLDKFRITVVVKGGGHRAQSEAIRHGTARVLVDFNANFRKRLRKAGFLTRDPRMRERKKFGLRRARRAPQWAKR